MRVRCVERSVERNVSDDDEFGRYDVHFRMDFLHRLHAWQMRARMSGDIKKKEHCAMKLNPDFQGEKCVQGQSGECSRRTILNRVTLPGSNLLYSP